MLKAGSFIERLGLKAHLGCQDMRNHEGEVRGIAKGD